VDDHLLPVERGVEVRHDADAPAGAVGRRIVAAERESLRRRAVLPALAKRALLELLGRRWIEGRLHGARAGVAAGSDRHVAAAQRINS
jgi:hypothetical protein